MSSNNNYTETIDYLYGLQRYGIKLGLENPRRLMSILGEPQKSFQSVHVAGTNGKGSTAAMIASILKESGLKVGLYTSPHLVSFTERIRINNSPISESDVIRLTSYIRRIIDRIDMKPTFFEFVTAMAFHYFACEKVDWAIVEVGMGGRLDATNVLLPEVSVITNIGLDHNEFLGETISDIAFEKAGIIKPSIPVVTAATSPEVLGILENTAKNCSSEIHIYGRDFKSTLISADDKHIVFDYRSINMSIAHAGSYRHYNNLSIPIAGKHQLYNASLALRVCEILIQKGLPLSDDIVNNGLLNLDFEGRLEWLSQRPPIIIDGAHNPEAARALTDAVKEIFPAKKIILIAGIMKDKDIKEILKPLMAISDAVILTKPKGERATSPEKLKESIEALKESRNKPSIPDAFLRKREAGVQSKNIIRSSVTTTNTVAEAIELAKTLCHKDNIILVTGSFYTTGEAKELLCRTAGVLSQLRE